ncbi:MAG: hypothetical protein K6G43_10565 [Lachnospiraceae bacterium]|nr:hypothetical protein [Lachnospiraceae bacterium]
MKKAYSILQSNKGASLVLVSILGTIVIGMSVTLIVVSSMLIQSSGRKTRENQAYELATSLSAKLEYMILNETEDGQHASQLDLTIPDGSTAITLVDSDPETGGGIVFEGIPDSSVKAVIAQSEDKSYYILTVTATAAGETYVRRTEYTGSKDSGYSRR